MSEKPHAGTPLAGVGRIGLALGSGAAKGWAHIGVIRALEEQGIHPEIVCGTSMGGIVGAAYAADRLDDFEEWAETLDWRNVVGYLDLARRGGLLKAQRLFEFFTDRFQGAHIEDLVRPFATVGTDLATGQEVWMREGLLLDALRSTVALPGLITPARWRGRWTVDGGLVNPVPVSLARALGADFVIAVDLNTTLLGRRFGEEEASPAAIEVDATDSSDPTETLDAEVGESALVALEERLGEGEAEAQDLPLSDRLNLAFRELASDVRERFASDSVPGPGMPRVFEVVANSINIMQVRIGRSRMAGDPPEMLVTPRLSDYGLLDFDRSAEAVDEGERALERAWTASFAGE